MSVYISKFNFDKLITRAGTGDLKHEALQRRWGRTDLLPLWVADMDWETPHFITDAIRERLDHSLFGYTVDPDDYKPSIIDWVSSHHNWQLSEEWITFIPGIVKGIGLAVNVFCEKDDAVIIQPPVYHPFRLTPQGNGRKVLQNPLQAIFDANDNLTNYAMDFDNLASIVNDYNSKGKGKVRLLILSNPHNPAGICWDKETLSRLAHFCYENDIIVLSDEIHCDMAIFGNHHIPFATVSEEAKNCSITFSAPSKTFNIAGIVSSWAVVPNDSIRRRYYTFLSANELNEPTLFAPIATIAAFRQGEEWRQQMLKYVEGNIDFVIDYCNQHIPLITPFRPQASFLVWLDCRKLKSLLDSNPNYQLASDPGTSYSPHGNRLLDFFIDKAHLALNDGEMFGPGGEGFMRLNIAAPRRILLQALEQLEAAIKTYTTGK